MSRIISQIGDSMTDKIENKVTIFYHLNYKNNFYEVRNTADVHQRYLEDLGIRYGLVENKLLQHFADEYLEATYYFYQKRHNTEANLANIHNIIPIPNSFAALSNPMFDPKTEMVYYFENIDKLKRGISSTIKLGRFIRKILNHYSDVEVEKLVKELREEFICPEVKFHSGETVEDFTFAYLSNNYRESKRDTRYFRSLWNSCMRYDFIGLPAHPAVVYASGDFEIHYMTDDEGKVCGRSVIHKESKTYGNIYAIQDAYGNLLKDHLENLGYQSADDVYDPWDGAKLQKIEVYGDSVLAVYIDNMQNVEDCGTYLKITSGRGDYEFNDTKGYVSQGCVCDDCGDSYSPDDLNEIDGELYCRHCSIWCEHTEEYVRGDTESVYYSRYTYETWSISAVEEDAIWVEDLHRFVAKSADYWTIYEYEGSFYTDEHLMGLGLVYNEDEGEWQEPEEEEETEE